LEFFGIFLLEQKKKYFFHSNKGALYFLRRYLLQTPPIPKAGPILETLAKKVFQ
jgi:hypothetical protein